MMRYAVIIAGGSGTRLWPMSTQAMPKQLIPFIDGKSLLQIAVERLEQLLPADRILICAGEAHRQAIIEGVPGMTAERFISEPMGRDTLNAVGLATGVIHARDPEAVVGIFTADHLITPVQQFVDTVKQGYELAESQPQTLVTFGIEPTHAATGYGYLQLAEQISPGGAMRVAQFKEKPEAALAKEYVAAGPSKYLWNSGMFVWQAGTLMHCIERFAPENYAGLMRCVQAWSQDDRDAVLAREYPQLEKISIDYAVMEPASQDEQVTVAAVPMPVHWLDVGSWPSFAKTREQDDAGNTAAGCRHLHLSSANTLVASTDGEHLIATLGVEDLIVIHTDNATLVCHSDHAQRIKELHQLVGEKFGPDLL